MTDVALRVKFTAHWRFVALFFGLSAVPTAIMLVNFGLGSAPFFVCSAILSIYVLGAALVSITGKRLHEIKKRRSIAAIFLFGGLIIIALSLMRHSTASVSYQLSAASNLKIVAMIFLPLVCIWLFERGSNAKIVAAKGVVAGLALAPVALATLDLFSGTFISYVEMLTAGRRVLSTSAISSPNSVAFVVSAGLLASLIALRFTRNPLWLVSGFIALIYMLLVQSKGAIAISVMTGVLLFASAVVLQLILRALVVTWVVSAPLLSMVYSGLSAMGFDALLLRPGAEYLGVATGRTQTWSSAMDALSSARISDLILGHGFMGAVDTQVRSTLAVVFRNTDEMELFNNVFSLHNASLQVVFDLGFLGLAVYLIGIVSAARCFIGKTSVERSAAVFFCFMLLWGLNESVGTIYFIFSVLPFFFVVSILIDPYRERREPKRDFQIA